MARTEAEKISQQKYNAKNYDRLAILLAKGKRDEYKTAAALRGMGFAEMVRASIEEYIANHKVD